MSKSSKTTGRGKVQRDAEIVELPGMARREGRIAARKDVSPFDNPYPICDMRFDSWNSAYDQVMGFNIPPDKMVTKLLHASGTKHQALKKIFERPEASEEIKRLAQMGMDEIEQPRKVPWFPDLVESEFNVRPPDWSPEPVNPGVEKKEG